ncbi:hypothetical protein [Phytomonospora endophytica]|uniref:Uncharacterized protein n=1 Tax=Phytomonospora endophytica TaxID=714109 RepID=A0A841FR69_9ACTN|nr:hypothetical protein [Phytomonospora endophytica]MBB6036278.1 hypothetical protein [Phytomonospora endophytica]
MPHPEEQPPTEGLTVLKWALAQLDSSTREQAARDPALSAPTLETLTKAAWTVSGRALSVSMIVNMRRAVRVPRWDALELLVKAYHHLLGQKLPEDERDRWRQLWKDAAGQDANPWRFEDTEPSGRCWLPDAAPDILQWFLLAAASGIIGNKASAKLDGLKHRFSVRTRRLLRRRLAHHDLTTSAHAHLAACAALGRAVGERHLTLPDPASLPNQVEKQPNGTYLVAFHSPTQWIVVHLKSGHPDDAAVQIVEAPKGDTGYINPL